MAKYAYFHMMPFSHDAYLHILRMYIIYRHMCQCAHLDLYICIYIYIITIISFLSSWDTRNIRICWRCCETSQVFCLIKSNSQSQHLENHSQTEPPKHDSRLVDVLRLGPAWFSMKKVLKPSSLAHSCLKLLSSWWFQPIWKILVKLDHFPKYGWK